MENSNNNSLNENEEEAREILPGGLPTSPVADLFQEFNSSEHEIKVEINDVETFGEMANEDEKETEKVQSGQVFYVEVGEDENLEYTYQLVGAPRQTNIEIESENETPNNQVEVDVRFLDVVEDSDSEEEVGSGNGNKDLNQGENNAIGIDINQLLVLPSSADDDVNDGPGNRESIPDNISGYSTRGTGALECFTREEILQHLADQTPDNEVTTTTTTYYDAIASTSNHAQAEALASRDVEKEKGSKKTVGEKDAEKVQNQNQMSKAKKREEKTDSDCNLVRPRRKQKISNDLREIVLRNDKKHDKNDDFLEQYDDDSDDIDYELEDDNSDDSSAEEYVTEPITRSSIAIKDKLRNQKNKTIHHKKAQMGACLSKRECKKYTEAEKAQKEPSSESKKSINLAGKKKTTRKINTHRAMQREREIMNMSDTKIADMRKNFEVLEKRGKATIKKKKVKVLDYTLHAHVDYKKNIYICILCEPPRHFSLYRNFNRHMRNFHKREKFCCLKSKCTSWSERLDNLKRHFKDKHNVVKNLVKNVDYERRDYDSDSE